MLLSSPGYLGAFGYNESPERLGPPVGFWRFDDDDAFHVARRTAIDLNGIFGELGAPTYCHDVLALDQNRRALFQLLILSVKDDLYPRQFDLMEQAVRWLQTQGYPDLDPADVGIEGTSRVSHAESMRKLAEFSAQMDREHAELRARRAGAEAAHAEQKRQQEAQTAVWQAQMDAETLLRPSQKREVLDRLCQHFDLPRATWLDIPPNYGLYHDPTRPAPWTLTDEEFDRIYADPIDDQFYEEVDRIIVPLYEHFNVPLPGQDWYSLGGMEEFYISLMTMQGKPIDLSWREE
jgi:hypothetical protein